MSETALPALQGTNPIGFLAAIGVMSALDRVSRPAMLRWTEEFVPHAMIEGPSDLDDVIAALDRDRAGWRDGPALWWPPSQPLSDAKPKPDELRRWAEAVYQAAPQRSGDADLFCALVPEGGLDQSGKAKPTHLHFTAGRQQFLTMARRLACELSTDDLREALVGPWRYQSQLPSFSWDARGERVYAVRATDPSKETRLGVPGADWLALLGLSAFPVAVANRSLQTTGCNREWKRSAFRWPLWAVPLDYAVVRSLVADPSLTAEESAIRRIEPRALVERGVSMVLEAPIRRSEYGSFGAAVRLAEA